MAGVCCACGETEDVERCNSRETGDHCHHCYAGTADGVCDPVDFFDGFKPYDDYEREEETRG
jgi:hypothetical protein